MLSKEDVRKNKEKKLTEQESQQPIMKLGRKIDYQKKANYKEFPNRSNVKKG